MRRLKNALQVKSDIGKDPLRLQNKELESALQQLERQKTRAKLERENIMQLEAEKLKPSEEEKPKR